MTQGNPGVRPSGEPVSMPTPREIRALKAVSGGATFAAAAAELKIPVGTLSDALTCLYVRLGIGKFPSRYRRQLAVTIGRREGWWTDDQ